MDGLTLRFFFFLSVLPPFLFSFKHSPSLYDGKSFASSPDLPFLGTPSEVKRFDSDSSYRVKDDLSRSTSRVEACRHGVKRTENMKT